MCSKWPRRLRLDGYGSRFKVNCSSSIIFVLTLTLANSPSIWRQDWSVGVITIVCLRQQDGFFRRIGNAKWSAFLLIRLGQTMVK